MRFSRLWTIYRKELLEALRDRRTLFVMVGIPVLLYPLALMLMSRLQESQEEAQKARTSRVALWGALPDGLAARFAQAREKVELLAWAGAPAAIRGGLEGNRFPTPPALPPQLDDEEFDKRPKPNLEDPVIKAAQQAILERKVDAVLIPWPGFSLQLAQGAAGTATILFDSVRPDSGKARERVSDLLRLYRYDLLKQRERDRSIASGFTAGVEIQSANVAPAKRKSGMLLGMLLPYLLIAFSVMSGFYAAIDMTAGEKERGTMQTLLCAPLESLEIITGKFFAVWTITMMATVVNLLSLAATFSRLRFIPGVDTTMPPSSYAVAFLLLLPISFMVTALFLSIGAFARDFKEGQNYLTPVLMGLIMPLMVTFSPGIELNAWLAFVPVINVALLIKAVFLGEWRADLLFLVLVSAFSYAALALIFAARVFERNNLLLGGKEGVGGIFDFKRHPGARPAPGTAVLLFALSLVLAFYGSLALEKRGLPVMLLVTEFLFFLAPVALYAWLKGFPARDTFALRIPHWRGILGALLVGISGWTIGGGLLVRLLPPPDSLVKALEKILLIEDKPAPLWEAWLLVALVPALCEELFFRGFLQSGFRRLGQWPAIFATALLFGLAHSSIYRLLPTMFLGVLFGYVVWRTGSIATGILAHALNNGLMATLARSREFLESLGLAGAKNVPWSIIALGALVLCAGLLLIRSTPRAGEA